VLGVSVDAELVGSVSAGAGTGVDGFAGAVAVFVLGGSAASRYESLAAGDGKGVGAPGLSAMVYVRLWWESGAAKGRGGDEEKKKSGRSERCEKEEERLEIKFVSSISGVIVSDAKKKSLGMK